MTTFSPCLERGNTSDSVTYWIQRSPRSCRPFPTSSAHKRQGILESLLHEWLQWFGAPSRSGHPFSRRGVQGCRGDLKRLCDIGPSKNMERGAGARASEPARRRAPDNSRVLLERSRSTTQRTQDVAERRWHIRIRQRHAGPYPFDILI